jgi:hypothetical protein
MKNLQEFLQSLESVVLKENNGKINQVQARTIKSSSLANLMTDIQDLGFEVGKVQKGFIVRVPNSENGSLVFGLDIQVKSLDYDFDSEVQAEIDRLAEIKARKSKIKKSAI